MNAIDLPKPMLSPEACRLFYKIVWYVRRFHKNATNPCIAEAASDVMDGLVVKSDPEVIELTKKGIVRRIVFGQRDHTGTNYSWILTPYGIESVTRIPFVADYCI